MAADPRTVFEAENAPLADAVVNLLKGEGIAAEVVTPPTESVSSPLLGVTEMVTPDALLIKVLDPKRAEAAKELLATAVNAAAIRAMREKRANRTGTVTATCEDCGKSSEWPATAMGTTETCPHCGGFMDVPDPDEDWSDVDFGEAEEEHEGNEK